LILAIGIALDSTYSYLQGRLSSAELEQILEVLRTLGFALYAPEMAVQLEDATHPQSLLRGLQEFREHLGGQLTVMLLDEIGRGVEVHEMDNELLVEAVRHLREYQPAAIC
jgi:3-dehydroquinate synthase